MSLLPVGSFVLVAVDVGRLSGHGSRAHALTLCGEVSSCSTQAMAGVVKPVLVMARVLGGVGQSINHTLTRLNVLHV